MPDAGNCGREQRGISDPLGSLEGGPAVDQAPANVRLVQAQCASVGEDPRGARVVVVGLGQRLVAELHQPREVGLLCPHQLEEDVRPLHAGRNVAQEPLEQRFGPRIARKAVEARSPQASCS